VLSTLPSGSSFFTLIECARRQRGEIDLLVGGVGAVAVGGQAVKGENAQRRGEIAVASAQAQI
jgi:hypothetical protein